MYCRYTNCFQQIWPAVGQMKRFSRILNEEYIPLPFIESEDIPIFPRNQWLCNHQMAAVIKGKMKHITGQSKPKLLREPGFLRVVYTPYTTIITITTTPQHTIITITTTPQHTIITITATPQHTIITITTTSQHTIITITTRPSPTFPCTNLNLSLYRWDDYRSRRYITDVKYSLE